MNPEQIPDVHCSKIQAAVEIVKVGYYSHMPGAPIPAELFALRKKAVAYLDAQFEMADN